MIDSSAFWGISFRKCGNSSASHFMSNRSMCDALQGSVMAAEAKQTCYEGSAVQSFQFYLEQSGEHEAIDEDRPQPPASRI